MVPVNVSSWRTISFWTKGDGRTYQVMVLSKSNGTLPRTKSFQAGATWSKVTIPLSEFSTDGSDLQAIAFAELAVPGQFDLLVDQVRLDR